MAGVPAKITWGRIFGAADEDQPTLNVRATIDTSDSRQLGIDLSDFMQGEVPVEITVAPRTKADPRVQIRAELVNAELLIESLAWKKPVGQAATLQFEVVKAGRQRTELQGFKIVGPAIAVDGALVLDQSNKVREFSFPSFSLNVVSRLNMSGMLRPDNVWDVKLQGSTFDGRDFFQSLFSIGQIRDKPLPLRKDHPGLDLKADIETVLGFQEISLKGLKLTMSKRAGQMTALTARGGVDTAGRGALAPLEVGMQQAANEPRRLVARSEDAGQLFRLVGFYPNMQGGRMRLDVNLDGRGTAEKTGRLYVERFDLLGDPVIYEVLQGPGQRARRQVSREVLPFDSMNAPFSVGHGQFVMTGC